MFVQLVVFVILPFEKRINSLVIMIGICHFNCITPSDPWDWSTYLHPCALVSAHEGKLPVWIRFNDKGLPPTRTSWFMLHGFLSIAHLRNNKHVSHVQFVEQFVV